MPLVSRCEVLRSMHTWCPASLVAALGAKTLSLLGIHRHRIKLLSVLEQDCCYGSSYGF